MIYVQRQINNHLQLFKKFARVYIDDIVIFSQTFQNHLQHLREVFILLKKLHIVLNPKKSYLGLPIIDLLGQKVSSLGLTIIQDKIEVIMKLEFLKNLRDLEIYLGLTGWLRQYVLYYVYITESLQEHKTLLTRQALQKDRP